MASFFEFCKLDILVLVCFGTRLGASRSFAHDWGMQFRWRSEIFKPLAIRLQPRIQKLTRFFSFCPLFPPFLGTFSPFSLILKRCSVL